MQGLAHVLIDAAVAKVENEGKGDFLPGGVRGCCRQPVPVRNPSVRPAGWSR